MLPSDLLRGRTGQLAPRNEETKDGAGEANIGDDDVDKVVHILRMQENGRPMSDDDQHQLQQSWVKILGKIANHRFTFVEMSAITGNLGICFAANTAWVIQNVTLVYILIETAQATGASNRHHQASRVFVFLFCVFISPIISMINVSVVLRKISTTSFSHGSVEHFNMVLRLFWRNIPHSKKNNFGPGFTDDSKMANIRKRDRIALVEIFSAVIYLVVSSSVIFTQSGALNVIKAACALVLTYDIDSVVCPIMLSATNDGDKMLIYKKIDHENHRVAVASKYKFYVFYVLVVIVSLTIDIVLVSI